MPRSDIWIDFAPGGHQRLHCWLFMPDVPQPSSSPLPLVIGGHGVACLKTQGMDLYGETFERAGYAVIMFDYRGFGQSEGWPRNDANVHLHQRDFEVVLEWARNDARFDDKRIALLGCSYGAAHATFVASRDTQGHIAAVVCLVPFSNGLRTAWMLMSIWMPAFIVLASVDWLVSKLSFNTIPPLYMPVAQPYDLKKDRVNAWRPALFCNADSPKGFAEMNNAAEGPDRTAARGLLQCPFYMPMRQSKKIKCPYLGIVVRGHDRICPKQDAEKMFARAPKGQLAVVGTENTGHFSIIPSTTNDNCAEEAASVALEFLKEHVPL